MKPRLLLLILLSGLILNLAGCGVFGTIKVEVSEEMMKHKSFPGFVAVVVQRGDTLQSLAEKYLKDPNFDWLIADFNEIDHVTPGMEIIIPLSAYTRGGLYFSGYQLIPVLCYHKFSQDEIDKMTVTQNMFDEQMKYLKDNGYRVITLEQLFDFLEFNVQLPSKSVVITADDGWRSFYDIAFPILKKYGFTATLFINADMITGTSKTLSWDQVRELSDGGVDIQNHTKSHRNLAKPVKNETFKEYFDAIVSEIIIPGQTIKNKLGKEVKYLAYPYGETNLMIISILKKNGYRGAFTVKRGGNAFFVNNYMVNRSMIYGDHSISDFEKNLTYFTSEAIE